MREALTNGHLEGTFLVRGYSMQNALPTGALKPVVVVSKDATVLDAVRAMADKKVSAVVVVEGERLLGIFTERDLAKRVVLAEIDPKKTPITEVMTTSVKTVRHDTDRRDARELMVANHIRHLPVLDRGGKVVSMLSMRHLLRADVSDLEETVWALVATSDAPGG
jgi:CBS domain-containing protein